MFVSIMSPEFTEIHTAEVTHVDVDLTGDFIFEELTPVKLVYVTLTSIEGDEDDSLGNTE